MTTTSTTKNFINPNEDTRIGINSRVQLHFSVSLENGTVIDSTFNRETPVSFTIGDGNLLQGFEAVLMGLRAGDKRTAHLTPSEAFGQANPDNIQTFAKTVFATTNAPTPEVGMMLTFEDKSHSGLTGVVKQVTDSDVIVDFNHPLADKNIIFQVEIFKVIPAGSQSVQLL